MNKKWYDGFEFPALGSGFEFNLDTVALPVLLKETLHQHSLGNQKAIYDYFGYGKSSQGNQNVIVDLLKKFEAKMCYKTCNNDFYKTLWMLDHGMVQVSMDEDHTLRVSAYSLHEDFIKELQETTDNLFVDDIEQGSIYAITAQHGSLYLENMGNAGIELTRKNYLPEVLEKYDFVVEELNSESPTGRITIIEGVPGSGKSHIIKGLLMEVPDAMFVLISPDMVSSLGNPEFIPLLLRQRHNYDGPIILVLEDADKCLVARAGDNMHSIQALLNLGDGILGSLLDIRIIATINANKLEMDKAISRPGRLSARLEVNYLDLKTANVIWGILVPEKPLPTWKDKLTLADVYLKARKSGWKPPTQNKLNKTKGNSATKVSR